MNQYRYRFCSGRRYPIFQPIVSRVTLTGAIITALLLAVTEYIQHIVLVQRREYQ